jgi:hypothetical protein
MQILTLLAGLALAPVAHADVKEAETCLRTKIWADYNEGWAVRTATNSKLGRGEHRIYLVTLYAGNEYKIRICGDSNVTDVDVVLHDANGDELLRDKTDDREPMLTYKPSRTDTYYVAVYAASVTDNKQKSGVALAVTYR